MNIEIYLVIILALVILLLFGIAAIIFLLINVRSILLSVPEGETDEETFKRLVVEGCMKAIDDFSAIAEDQQKIEANKSKNNKVRG